MKKLFAILMAVAILLSLAVTAIADEPTGSITITNATKDQTYTIYKIFDASIQLGTDGKAEAVAYSIKPDNQFFTALFGADGTTDNAYFTYEPSTGAVAKKAAAVNTEVIAYLTELVDKGNYTPAATPVVASTATVVFDNLPYGYYLIESSLGSTVTINSNTPDVQVIDKNQKPATTFKKEIATSFNDEKKPLTWGTENTASIGDVVTYKISFNSTNYDGDKQIKYYQIHDTKGEGIWAEFNSFHVTVNGVELDRGYYLSQGDASVLNVDGWEYLGDWGTTEKNRNNAQWYLVHLGVDEYRITIPWLEGHTLTDVLDPNTGKLVSYSLNFPANAAPKYTSPSDVEIIYQAAVEPNATIGGTVSTNLFNRAYASWTSEHETGYTETSRVETKVYGIGLLKDDGATGINLAGAEFRIYSDSACTKPVYVIPTDIDGIYIVDSLGTPGSLVSGSNKDTARKLYASRLEEYLGADYATKQDNLVVSQVNGKLVVLGLEAGTYYLKEVKAPNGYNSLSTPVEIKAGEGIKSFSVFADVNGKVADIQTDDGTHHEHFYQLTSTIVHNSKGVELPSTGGEGTALLITIGAILAIVFAVFLITNKKMSIYND